MKTKTFVTYCRVSTDNRDCWKWNDLPDRDRPEVVKNQNGQIVGEFSEVESGGKTDKGRPQLSSALTLCKKTKSTLVVAKLDRPQSKRGISSPSAKFKRGLHLL